MLSLHTNICTLSPQTLQLSSLNYCHNILRVKYSKCLQPKVSFQWVNGACMLATIHFARARGGGVRAAEDFIFWNLWCVANHVKRLKPALATDDFLVEGAWEIYCIGHHPWVNGKSQQSGAAFLVKPPCTLPDPYAA